MPAVDLGNNVGEGRRGSRPRENAEAKKAVRILFLSLGNRTTDSCGISRLYFAARCSKLRLRC